MRTIAVLQDPDAGSIPLDGIDEVRKKDRARRVLGFTVDRLPSRAGVDPYNKLVDRIAEDNLLDVALK